ncbi:MAG: sel1 repeat family protein, partial [Emcibacteraceae bacterium]|nr:sel1 repeat family protein [Emcibacteraceae bacterium]
MKKALLITAVLMTSNMAHADIDKAQQAYKDKDFKTAYAEFMIEAKANNREALYTLGLMYGRGEGMAQDFTKALASLSAAADLGHVNAQFLTSNMYRKGQGIPPDMALAAKYSLMAAEQNHMLAQNNIGLFYANGLGIPKNEVKAAQWTLKAAEAGHAEAQNTIARYYVMGFGIAIDQDKAAVWFRKAAAQGHKKALASVAAMDDPKNNRAMVKLEMEYSSIALKGDVDAQLNMATINAFGIGIPQDMEMAARYYMKAANAGNAMAQYEIANLYENGNGVEGSLPLAHTYYYLASKINYNDAEKRAGLMAELITPDQLAISKKSIDDWFSINDGYAKANYDNIKLSQIAGGIIAKTTEELAAEQGAANEKGLLTRANAGDKEAQFKLGAYYHEKGDQHPEAVKWYAAAGNNGHSEAAFRMAGEYTSDGEITKDVAKAIIWFKKSADLGFTDAQIQLANIYFNKKAGFLNYKEGLKYYRIAAAKNDPAAQFALGRAYSSGFGVKQNSEVAKEWFIKAAKTGQG